MSNFMPHIQLSFITGFQRLSRQNYRGVKGSGEDSSQITFCLAIAHQKNQGGFVLLLLTHLSSV